jgi:septal ring-binding cell division protein DamX
MTAPETESEATEQPADSAPESEKAETPRSRGGLWAAAFFAVAALGVWWWTSGKPTKSAVPAAEIQPNPAGPAKSSATPTAKPAAVRQPAVETEGRKDIVVVPDRPPKATRPAERPIPAKAAVSTENSTWRTAAERGRRVFEHPGTFAYTIQLELACQESTLTKALAADPAGKRIWIAPNDFRGQRCYRVLFGKYRDLAAARSAKASIPAIFLKDGNHPAVIALSAKNSARKR